MTGAVGNRGWPGGPGGFWAGLGPGRARRSGGGDSAEEARQLARGYSFRIERIPPRAPQEKLSGGIAVERAFGRTVGGGLCPAPGQGLRKRRGCADASLRTGHGIGIPATNGAKLVMVSASLSALLASLALAG